MVGGLWTGLPSHPHTGLKISIQASGRVSHVPTTFDCTHISHHITITITTGDQMQARGDAGWAMDTYQYVYIYIIYI